MSRYVIDLDRRLHDLDFEAGWKLLSDEFITALNDSTLSSQERVDRVLYIHNALANGLIELEIFCAVGKATLKAHGIEPATLGISQAVDHAN